MGRDYSAHASYGYYVTGQHLRDVFGQKLRSKTNDSDWSYAIPNSEAPPSISIFEFIDELCNHLTKSLKFRVGYSYEGNTLSDCEAEYGYVIGVFRLSIDNEEGGLTLEQLMRDEENTCAVGDKLRELGLQIHDWPMVYAMLVAD